MEALSRAYIEFKLGKRFKDAKIWSCKVYTDDGEKLRSAQYFRDQEKAKRYVQVLEKFERNPHIVKYYYSFYDKDNKAGQPKAGILVFTEPVISFDTWLDNPKIKMWAYNSSKTRIVGMGEDFINIFGQLGIVLKQVAQSSLPNGNLSKGGFMVGERDGKVRLCNFNMDDEGSSGELERYHADLSDFKYLIGLAIERHPPDVPFRGDVDPIYEFNRLCDADPDLLKYNLRKILNSSRWLYRAIVFWDPHEQRLTPTFGSTQTSLKRADRRSELLSQTSLKRADRRSELLSMTGC